MNFFSKLFTPPDPETEKQTAFENIERVYEGDKVINQQKASWLTMRGNNYGVRGKLDMAISDFKEALGYEPNRPSTLVSLGGTYTHNKMWKDGIAILEKAENFLSHIEDDAMREMEKQLLYYELGTAYFFSDNIKKSIANLSQSISSAVGLGVYKDCGDISTDEWAKISHAKRNAEQLLKKIKDTQNITPETVSIARLAVIDIAKARKMLHHTTPADIQTDIRDAIQHLDMQVIALEKYISTQLKTA